MEVVFLLDESGSMGQVHDETLRGVNSYIQELKDENVMFTLVLFNSDRIKTVYNSVPVKDVRGFSNYRPTGMTPLVDAVGKTIKGVGKKRKVIFVVQTDGKENASTKFKTSEVYELVTKRKKRGWTFAFMGADIDAWDVARGLGFDQENVIQYKSEHTETLYAAVSSSTSRAIKGGSSGGFWGSPTDEKT
jgi:hypothetical protein